MAIDRFVTPGHRVAYFSVVPIEVSSGIDQNSQTRAARRYLWVAALSAIRYHPTVRALCARVMAR